MKTLIVYYSLDGNTHFVAEQIQHALGADTFRIETADDSRRKGLSKMFWGGRMVLTHAVPELKPYTVDIESRDLVIIGCPVWAGSPAPPLPAFLAKTPVKGKRVALFVCHGGGRGAVLEKLKALLPGNTFVGDLDLNNPLSQNITSVSDRISAWAKNLG